METDDEDAEVRRGADQRMLPEQEASGGDDGGLPQARDQRLGLPPVEGEVRRDGRVGDLKAEGAGGQEPGG